MAEPWQVIRIEILDAVYFRFGMNHQRETFFYERFDAVHDPGFAIAENRADSTQAFPYSLVDFNVLSGYRKQKNDQKDNDCRLEAVWLPKLPFSRGPLGWNFIHCET
jgi:hypothetical protein